mgnify:FL=1
MYLALLIESNLLSIKMTKTKTIAIKINPPGIVAQKSECHGKYLNAFIPDFTGIEIDPKANNSLQM